MWIQELNVKNFGKFSEANFKFKPGINLIYGENESGKSTLHTFIKGCFYGIRKMRGRGAAKDVYSRYEPWDNPAYYAGSLRFVCAEKVFRLERDFYRMTASERLICESDGEQMSPEDGDLRVLLGGTGETVFENTVFIGQMKSRTDEGLALELKNYMANCQGSGDGALDVGKAVTSLKNRKKELEKREQEDRKKKQERERQLYSRMEYIREELAEDREDLHKQIQILEKLQEDTEYFPETESRRKGSGIKGLIMVLELLVIFLITALAIFHIESLAARIGTGCLGILAILVGRGLNSRFGKGERSDSAHSARRQEKAKRERLRWAVEHLEKEIREKEIQLENLKEERQTGPDEEEESRKENLAALDLSMEIMDEIVRSMQSEMGKHLKRRTSEILSQITEGRYQSVQLDESFQAGVHTRDRYIPIEQLSRGTMEQVYFALRMASGEMLCPEEPLPVLLDDVFAMYDQERLCQTLSWLSRQKRQVLIFTCHKREGELLRKLGIPYESLVLGTP